MAIAFVATGSGGDGGSAGVYTYNGPNVTTAGHTVIVWCLNGVYNDTPVTTVTYGGTAMHKHGEVEVGASLSPEIDAFTLSAFSIVVDGSTVPTGTQSVVVTMDTADSFQAQWSQAFEYSGVGAITSVSLQSTAYTTGSALSQSATSSTGDLVSQAFAACFANPGGALTFTGYNQTSRWQSTAGDTQQNQYGNLLVGDAAGASSVSFTATSQYNNSGTETTTPVSWTGGALDLPAAAVASNYTASPAATSVTVTPSAASTSGPSAPYTNYTASPASTTVTVSPVAASDSLVQGQLANPMANVLAKIGAGQNIVIASMGDSTLFANAVDYIEPANTPTYKWGWFGRIALALGQYYDYTVHFYANNSAGTTYQEMGSPASSNATVPFYSGGTPTITAIDGGWSGSILNYFTIPTDNIYYNAGDATGWSLIPDTWSLEDGGNTPDLFFICSGINGDVAPTDYNYAIAQIRSYLGNSMPIVVVTQNPVLEGYTDPIATFETLSTDWCNGTFPMNPVMQRSSVDSNVWLLDTRSTAFASITDPQGSTTNALMFNQQHPNAEGFDAYASSILTQIAPQVTGGFATANGNKFELAGESFTFVGANNIDMMDYYTGGTEQTSAQVEAYFALWPEGTVHRTYADQEYGGGSTNTSGFDQLDVVVQAAALYGQKLIVSLANGNGAEGLPAGATAAWFTGGYESTTAAHQWGAPPYPDTTTNYATWISTVCGHYATSEAIFAWEIMNEPGTASGVTGLTNAQMATFLTAAAGLIRAADANHMVTWGFHGAYNQSWCGSNSDLENLCSMVDFIEVHEYPYAYESGIAIGAQTNNACTVGAALSKPVVLGEYGVGNPSGTVTLAQRITITGEALGYAFGTVANGTYAELATWPVAGFLYFDMSLSNGTSGSVTDAPNADELQTGGSGSMLQYLASYLVPNDGLSPGAPAAITVVGSALTYTTVAVGVSKEFAPGAAAAIALSSGAPVWSSVANGSARSYTPGGSAGIDLVGHAPSYAVSGPVLLVPAGAAAVSIVGQALIYANSSTIAPLVSSWPSSLLGTATFSGGGQTVKVSVVNGALTADLPVQPGTLFRVAFTGMDAAAGGSCYVSPFWFVCPSTGGALDLAAISSSHCTPYYHETGLPVV